MRLVESTTAQERLRASYIIFHVVHEWHKRKNMRNKWNSENKVGLSIANNMMKNITDKRIHDLNMTLKK